MASVVERIRSKVRKAVGEAAVNRAHKRVDDARVDPRIQFPCYKSFDDLIDVERLQALDDYVTERVRRHAKNLTDEKFHTGEMTISKEAPKVPGSRIIYLSKSQREYNYLDLNKAELWGPTEESAEFASLMEFIKTLPFKSAARMMIMYDDSGSAVTAHRDHTQLETSHEFLWFRTNKGKPFYMLNNKTGQKKYVESHAAWFDTCNQFHGADAKEGLSVSMRVDGVFSDELRARIPVPEYNAASTASLWACVGDNKR